MVDTGHEDRDGQGFAVLKVLSYNLWHGRAQRELESLITTHSPDVLCVQEAYSSSLPNRLGDLVLASGTTGNRLAVALYVRSERFVVEASGKVRLSLSRHDRLVGGTEHRLVTARVNDRQTGRRLVLGSFHGTPFTDSNAFRRLQVDDAHEALRRLGPGLPTVMAGDYNHPVLLSMLRRHLKRRGFTVARTATSTFHKNRSLVRGKFDLATISGLDVSRADVLARGASDHRPVLFTFEYSG
ncbi:exonuclease [Subtercola sp. Z020]|uniref:endonuclease/exonuclease/phosphatase family protein n=1 Tax=Subtercola sp. Z020 TaxID=2080582 RepID=UPI000CE89839|nr:endonuclease/exonuclease/phosphatase family protein [Subtercola sp. Z020]PPF90120.1 exonuclease [Subtercola sp. Z020]